MASLNSLIFFFWSSCELRKNILLTETHDNNCCEAKSRAERAIIITMLARCSERWFHTAWLMVGVAAMFFQNIFCRMTVKLDLIQLSLPE